MTDAAIRAAYDPEPDWAGLRPPASGAEEAADPRLPQSAGPSVTRRGHALVLLIEAPVQEEPASRAGGAVHGLPKLLFDHGLPSAIYRRSPLSLTEFCHGRERENPGIQIFDPENQGS